MSVDFTNLNQTCTKDCFLFPKIDQLMDETTRFEYLSSLNAYSRYHQIPIIPEDEENTTFVMDEGICC